MSSEEIWRASRVKECPKCKAEVRRIRKCNRCDGVTEIYSDCKYECSHVADMQRWCQCAWDF